MTVLHRTLTLFALSLAALGLAACSGLGSGAGDSETPHDAPAEESRPAEVLALEDQLTAIGLGFDGYLGIAVIDLENGDLAALNGGEWFPQQSVSKLWVAITALDRADRGKLDLAETAAVRFDDLTLFYQPVRKLVLANGAFAASYEEFLRRALTESDNTANDMVLRRVGGPDAVRAMLEDKELAGIRFGPGERAMQSKIAAMEWRQLYALEENFFKARKLVPEERRRAAFDAYVTDPVDGAQPAAIARALARLAEGELLGPEASARMLGWLGEVKSGPNRLKGGLPEGWGIAHKTGTGQVLDIVPPGVIGEQAGYNDVGILTAPGGRRYAVAVMIGRTRRPVPERMDLMHAVVGAVADYHYAVTGQPRPEATP
jgi:beta-lactamase class A